MIGFGPISDIPISSLFPPPVPPVGMPAIGSTTQSGGSADSGATILDNRRRPWRGGSEEPEYTPRFYRVTAYGLLRFSGRFSVWLRQEPAPRKTAIGQFSIKGRCDGSFRDRLKVGQEAEELVLGGGGWLTAEHGIPAVADPLQAARDQEDAILGGGGLLNGVNYLGDGEEHKS